AAVPAAAKGGAARLPVMPGFDMTSLSLPETPYRWRTGANIVMSAGAVGAMLKEKGLSKGNLYDEIDKAAADHLITPDMAKWAHQVGLDAKAQRHADASAPLPKQEDAQR